MMEAIQINLYSKQNVDSVINLATIMVKSVVIIRSTHCIGLSGTLASVVSDAKMVSSMFALTHSLTLTAVKPKKEMCGRGFTALRRAREHEHRRRLILHG